MIKHVLNIVWHLVLILFSIETELIKIDYWITSNFLGKIQNSKAFESKTFLKSVFNTSIKSCSKLFIKRSGIPEDNDKHNFNNHVLLKYFDVLFL